MDKAGMDTSAASDGLPTTPGKLRYSIGELKSLRRGNTTRPSNLFDIKEDGSRMACSLFADQVGFKNCCLQLV